MEVRVPQQSGSISIARDGDKPTTWHVTDGTTNVGEEHLADFLAQVDGSSVVEAKPVSAKKEK